MKTTRFSIGIDEVGRGALAGSGEPRPTFLIGIDEVGRAARRRASPEQYIVGVDEVGRGALAGPVVVAAVRHAASGARQARALLFGIRDSKKLTPKQREEWCKKLLGSPMLECAVSRAYPATIDRINISSAANLAAARAYNRLMQDSRTGAVSSVMLDGGLFLRGTALVLKPAREKTIVKGDEKFPLIAAASIVAKVSRDRFMARLHRKYPAYRFDIHKGYGTSLHRKLIKEKGISEVHRRSFRADFI